MATIHDLRTILDSVKQSPEGVGYNLRMDLADIIMGQLDARGWTQKQLADAAQMKEPMLTRILHSASNCTFDVAGRLLFALRVQAKLMEVPSGDPLSALPAPLKTTAPVIINTQATHGKAEKPQFRVSETPTHSIRIATSATTAVATTGSVYQAKAV